VTVAGNIDVEAWVGERFALFEGTYSEQAGPVTTIAEWAEAARQATSSADVVLAGSFQRHLTARGTGLPSNFALALTADEVIALKFNPRNAAHPIHVGEAQFKKEVGRWPRGSVRFSGLERGRMAWGATLEIDGTDPIPCRTPAMQRNPAAAIVLAQLGADPADVA
jgi:hypothetical protein